MINKIKDYIQNQYGIEAEYPFKEDDTLVFRNTRNKKWFGIIMHIPASKLGLNSNELVYVMNLKNYPFDVSMLRATDGIFPAYHMNKENWFTILLDDKVPLEMIFVFIDQSYDIINKKK